LSASAPEEGVARNLVYVSRSVMTLRILAVWLIAVVRMDTGGECSGGSSGV
jgi:hypothetical protein